MAELRIRTLDGTDTAIPAPALEGLAARLRGAVLRPGDAGYDEARAVWNATIDRRPALVVRCAGAADVIDAVNFARDHGLLLSVRGGGHNIAGTAVCDGGLMIDLSPLKGIHVDPAAQTVRVQPGAAWGDVDRETQVFGLAVPSGIVSTTGVAGLTLGGGFGWLTRKHGFTCDSLLSVDIVTADGALRSASAGENPDLFWGVRGGGGNFGVVTSFEFRAHPVGPRVVAGMVLHPMERAPEVLGFFRELTAGAPEELHGAPVAAIAVCHAGPIEDGERAVGPLKAFGPPLVDLIGPKPFAAHQTMLDAAQPPGRHYYWKSEYLPDLGPEAATVLIDHAGRITSPQSAVMVMHLGGAAARVPRDATAAANRDAEYVLNVAGSWLDARESDRHIGWVQGLWRAMRPLSTGGTYVNFLTGDAEPDRVRAAYGPATYDRLAALKARYDPTNLFRLNQNIRPAG